MSAGGASLKVPLALASVWLLTVSLSALAAPVLMVAVPYWHEVRGYLQQLGMCQAWISIAACVGLMVISRKKHSENEQQWAQGALLIYVLGGLLTAVVLNYGVLLQWLAHPNALLRQIQVLVLMLLHWLCAGMAWRTLWIQR